MQTRSSSRLTRDQSSNPTSSTNTTPKGRNRRNSKQRVESSNLEEHLPPVVTMADNRTMAELLRAPTEGYAEAIVVPPILAEQFELKHSLINMMTTDQFFGLQKDNPHDHIRWFNKITSIIKYRDTPNSAIKLIHFPFSLAGAARRWLEKEPPLSITTWEDLVSKFINELFPPSRTTSLRNEISNFQQRFDESFHEAWDRYKDLLRACPRPSFTELHQLDTFHNGLNLTDQDSLNATAGGNLLERSIQDVLTIIENKSKCLATGGNTFPELKDNIQGYVSAAVVNYNLGNPCYRPQGVANQIRPQGSGSLPSNTIPNLKGELKAITTRSGLVTNGPTIPTPPKSITSEVDERVEETYTDPDLAKYTIKKIIKALLSNKEKLQELTNTPLNENCLAVILKKIPEKLRDPRKFLIPCGFSELKCKALVDLANRAICTPDGIARDVFVPVGMFTFPADFVIVDYESDPRVPLILGRTFLRTARALINVHGDEMILYDGDERLTLNMRHDTSSYSNQPQKESVNLINIFNVSSEDYLEDLFSKRPKGCNVLSEKLPDLDSTKDLL
uniref:Reverse transcriptase domain-containing protein n=1 Tax=Tanacetum cinerariifolium TaxID=118510 RepID=A0A699JGK5_TANCI|nr:reverse transcriptase domain-containing protein [Tanacetum cinerariifolium]